jgi:hypothetical protein
MARNPDEGGKAMTKTNRSRFIAMAATLVLGGGGAAFAGCGGDGDEEQSNMIQFSDDSASEVPSDDYLPDEVQEQIEDIDPAESPVDAITDGE